MRNRIARSILFLTVSCAAQSIDKPAERARYFYDQRRFPHDRVPPGARVQAVQAIDGIERALRSGKLAPRSADNSGPWKFIGPRPIDFGGGYFNSGRTLAIAVDPRSSDVVYAGTAEGGVWKTSDGGTTWTPLTDDQASLAIGSIAIDPSNPDTVYVGTGEGEGAIDAYYEGAGILKSIDAGATWRNIPGPFVQQSINGVTVDPTDGRTVLAAANTGVYRSSDGGETWVLSRSGKGISVFFDPAQPGVAWAAIGNENGNLLNGVYRSTDNGLSWTLTPGTGTNKIPTGTAAGRIQIVNAPATPNSLYAVIANKGSAGYTLNGVYRTNDGGATWTNLNAPDLCGGQCWYDMVIQPHPTDPSLIIAGGSTHLIRSLDGGITWQSQQLGIPGYPHVDHHAMAFTKDGTRLYNANDGGMWSTDALRSAPIVWNNLNATLGITQYYPGLAMHPTNPLLTLGGAQDNGVHLYTGQLTWEALLGGDGGWSAIDPSLPETAYMTLAVASVRGQAQTINLYRGQQLTSLTSVLSVVHGIDLTDRHYWIPPFVMDPSVPQRMYYGTYRLYQSLDGGGQWRAISPDLSNPPPQISPTTYLYTISAIAVAPADPKTIYTGSIGSGNSAVYQTIDSGSTWHDRSAGLPFRSVTQVAVDPLDPSTAYATFSGYALLGEPQSGHVYRTHDGGNSWTDISGALPNIPVNDLVIDADVPGTLYVATDAGVMVTTDGGSTWNPMGTGLPRVAVLSLVMQRSTRTLRAATHGRSMWDYVLPTVVSSQPVISSLSPAGEIAGDPGFILTIKGSNLGSGMHVLWNGQDRQVGAATQTSMTVQIPASDIQLVGRASVMVFNPASGGGASTPASFIVGPAPAISAGGLVSSATTSIATASPGAIVSLYGSNLTGMTINTGDYAVVYPLPSTLGGLSVNVGGSSAPLYYVSPGFINFQVPYTASSRATQIVTVTQGTMVSAAVQLAIAPVSPGLYSTNAQGTGQGSIRIATDPLAPIAAPVGVFPGSRPAKRSEYISIYCTGLGAVSPAAVAGYAASLTQLQDTVARPTVLIGNVQATLQFSGLTPGYAGLYVVNVQVPDGAPSGDAVPITFTIGGVTANTVTVAIAP